MHWLVARLAFDIMLSSCPPPAAGALYGRMGIGTFDAAVCYRRIRPATLSRASIIA